ncbi:MAG: CAP domain-containing protein [Solirubrobacteraceae bacterium]
MPTGAVLACAGALATAVLACAGGLAADTAGADTAGADTAGSACRDANLRPTVANLGAVDAATLCLVNKQRTARGLRPLHANRELGHVAASQVGSMVRRDYFADVGPSGRTPLSLVTVTRYPAHAAEVAVGQNIAWGTGSYTTPAHIVQEWMDSPPHREIMLSGEYRDAGVASTSAVPAVLDTSGRGATYVIEFGARL